MIGYRSLYCLASLLGLLCVMIAGVASAQHSGVDIERPHRGVRDTELNLHAGFSYRGQGPAAGFRFAFPIVDNGFVPSIDNAVYISVGGDFIFEDCVGGCGKRADKYGAAVAVPVTLRWQFNFNPAWSAYAELGPNFYFHSGWTGSGKFPGVSKTIPGWFAGAIGAKWHFAPRTSLTFAVGAPYPHVGLDILL